MFRPDCEPQGLIHQLQRLECRISIPQELLNVLLQKEASHGVFDDRRRFQRRKCPIDQAAAGMLPLANLPSLTRERCWQRVYIADVSRGGIGFLHSEPLYPMEQVQLVIPSGAKYQLEVVRCRRVASSCFTVGASFAVRLESKPPHAESVPLE